MLIDLKSTHSLIAVHKFPVLCPLSICNSSMIKLLYFHSFSRKLLIPNRRLCTSTPVLFDTTASSKWRGVHPTVCAWWSPEGYVTHHLIFFYIIFLLIGLNVNAYLWVIGIISLKVLVLSSFCLIFVLFNVPFVVILLHVNKNNAHSSTWYYIAS